LLAVNKALAKTLFHFFSALGLWVGKKNESVFCALAIEFFCAVAFFLIFFLCVCRSKRCQLLSKLSPKVRSKSVSLKSALSYLNLHITFRGFAECGF